MNNFFDERYTRRLKEQGVPDAEAVVEFANHIMDLLNQRRFKEARALIDRFEEPSTRKVLELAYAFDSKCWCFIPR